MGNPADGSGRNREEIECYGNHFMRTPSVHAAAKAASRSAAGQDARASLASGRHTRSLSRIRSQPYNAPMSDDISGQRFVIAGGSGFLGVSIAAHLADAGWSVVILSRHCPPIDGPW